MALPIVAIDLFGQPFSHIYMYISTWIELLPIGCINRNLKALKIIDYSRFFVLGLLLTEYEVRRLFLMSVISRD